MNHTYQEEFFSDELIEELSTLTELSWRESKCSPFTHYDPDWDKYIYLNEMNLLRLFTARNLDDEIIGYITFFVGPTLHSKGVIQALHDSMYILKPYRKNGTAKQLLEFSEEELKKNNVNMVVVTVMIHRDFSPTLKQIGFTHTESTFIKGIG